MADEPREYLRAAQAAEVRGDKTHAAELLFKAAQLYRSQGKSSRALSVLRHAQRLDPSREELAEEIQRLEWLPEQPLKRSHDDLEAEMKRVLEPLEAMAVDSADGEISIAGEPDTTLPGVGRNLIEKGPTLADPDASAWCSFCCRPTEEAGRLVAGPAGAFVCGDCVRESTRLLGDVLVPAPATAPAAPSLQPLPQGTVAQILQLSRLDEDIPIAGTALEALTRPASAQASASADAEVTSQSAAQRELEQALDGGRRRILVIGPAGAGKSTVVRRVVESRRGFLFGPSSAPRSVPEDWLIALDDAPPTTQEGWARTRTLWERHGGVVILTTRGCAPAPDAAVLTEDARVPLASTQAIVAATYGALPLEVAEQVDAVVVLDALDEPALGAMASTLMGARGFAESFIAEAAPALAKSALASSRGAHELVALVRRLPQGAWKLEAVTPPRPGGNAKRRARRKGDGT
ncbi:MAG: ClpX C4-type zinc finger protein [Myxococcaceae bacterium]|nr:ClpX C4-type zinc finger protein [Myxococcaceae bacterium]